MMPQNGWCSPAGFIGCDFVMRLVFEFEGRQDLFDVFLLLFIYLLGLHGYDDYACGLQGLEWDKDYYY